MTSTREAAAGKATTAREPSTTAAERAEAKAMRSSSATGGTRGEVKEEKTLAHLPRVAIDENAVQKYVLVEVVNHQAGGKELFVRGDANADYHKDAARPLVQQLRTAGVEYTVLGGGRISHLSSKRTIKVYGFSYGFPWKDDVSRHAETCDVLRGRYPGYDISWTDEGY